MEPLYLEVLRYQNKEIGIKSSSSQGNLKYVNESAGMKDIWIFDIQKLWDSEVSLYREFYRLVIEKNTFFNYNMLNFY